ncbi:uncharacterized protein LOC127257342 [Andrographis paniculata]|uniref:uncharacterized protein LOC127257342 n=1 Tax=Andrographis paniculata TaxID=175694 RepID=UPI0021E6F4D9|nr:uncharacterized protein LOC127257342 [Andrographis paniculata]
MKMGNGGGGEDDQQHCNNSNKATNTFLPMFCRLSLNDIKPPAPHPYKTPIAGAGDPGSPRVSCIGQVKRNSRVVGFPAAGHHKHRKPFSAKTLLPNTALSGSRTCRPSVPPRSVRTILKDNNNNNNNNVVSCGGGFKVVDVGEMDPPLPVVKRAAAAAAEVSLWERRGKSQINGVEIQRLRIEEIKIGGNNGGFRFQTSPTTA